MGGVDLYNPKELAQEEYRNSRSATGPLVRAISEQKRGRMHEHLAEAANIRNDLKVQKRKHQKERADIMRDQASNNMKLAVDLAKEKGASSWLSVLPIEEFGTQGSIPRCHCPEVRMAAAKSPKCVCLWQEPKC